MREYETIYILKSDLPEEAIKSLQEKIEKIISKASGHILCHVSWGKRKFAYEIQKLKQGQYFYLQYLSLGNNLEELDRTFKYDDNVLRALTVKLKDKVDAEKRLASPVEAPPAPDEDSHDSSQHERRGPRRHRGPREDFDSGDEAGESAATEEKAEAAVSSKAE